jgi:hypothetical protein
MANTNNIAKVQISIEGTPKKIWHALTDNELAKELEKRKQYYMAG